MRLVQAAMPEDWTPWRGTNESIGASRVSFGMLRSQGRLTGELNECVRSVCFCNVDATAVRSRADSRCSADMTAAPALVAAEWEAGA